MRFFAQLLMGEAEVVGASDEIHPRLQRFHPCRRMAAFARERSKAFAKGTIQVLTKSGNELRPSIGSQQQLLCFLMSSSGNFARDFHDSLLLRMLDQRGNAQIGPRLQCTSASTRLLLDFSRKARTLLLGEAAKPSVLTSRPCTN